MQSLDVKTQKKNETGGARGRGRGEGDNDGDAQVHRHKHGATSRVSQLQGTMFSSGCAAGDDPPERRKRQMIRQQFRERRD